MDRNRVVRPEEPAMLLQEPFLLFLPALQRSFDAWTPAAILQVILS